MPDKLGAESFFRGCIRLLLSLCSREQPHRFQAMSDKTQSGGVFPINRRIRRGGSRTHEVSPQTGPGLRSLA